MEHLSKHSKIIIMLAITSAMYFAVVNQTIVTTVLPSIVDSLGGEQYFNWVYTLFMLASSIAGILVGRLSDLYGRKIFLLGGILTFLIASLLCGFSTSILELIIYRAFQGMGGGIIISTSHSVVGDLFPPIERGKWQGFLVSGNGLASISGPTIGGLVVDSLNWNWVFWLFLPIGIIAFLLIYRLLPKTIAKGGESIDYLGSLTLSVSMVCLLLIFSLGGVNFNWISLPIIGLVATTVIMFILFIKIEKSFHNPIVPLGLFNNNDFTLTNIASFLTSFGFFGLVMYVPFFIQNDMGLSASMSGLLIMPQMIFMTISSTLFGILISKTGKYKIIAIFGMLLISVGMILIATFEPNDYFVKISIYLSLLGIGMGAAFPVFTLCTQNLVPYSDLGVATSIAQLARQLGATIGVAIASVIVNSSENISTLFWFTASFVLLGAIIFSFTNETELKTTNG